MTPEDLVQLELLRRLKYSYCRLLDQKRFDDLGQLFIEAGTASYGGGAQDLSGRAAIVEFLKGAMGSTSVLSSHLVSHPEIDLVGPDAATASWALQDVVILQEHGLTLRGASYYSDRYVKVGGSWRIEHTGYKRLYEEIGPRVGGTRTTADWWATGGRSSVV